MKNSLLDLKSVVLGDIKHFTVSDNLVVASIIPTAHIARLSATLGDDEHTLSFQFAHSGPAAIIYPQPIYLKTLKSRQYHLAVVAIMSAVFYADISCWTGISQTSILPTPIMQYDAGNPHLYDQAQNLICQYTGQEWDPDFLTKCYRQQASEFISRYFPNL